jgi:hypothetical protein
MFFYNETELKDYVFINASFDFNLIKGKLIEVDREILKVHFGVLFIDTLQTAYDGITAGNISTLSVPIQKAIKKMREISAPLAISLWVTPGQLNIASNGIFIASTENRKTAFEWQINNLIKSYLKPAYQALEEAIFILSKDATNYPTYTAFEESIYYKSVFVSDSKAFTKLYSPLRNSFMSYLALRSCMDKVEDLDIKNVLLPTYYTALKGRLLAGTLTAYDLAIMPMIKAAVVNLTVFKAINELGASFDENGFMTLDNTSGVKSGDSVKNASGEPLLRLAYSLRDSGNNYINNLKAYLEKNKANYLEYTSDPDYVSDLPAHLENDTTNQTYFVGM